MSYSHMFYAVDLDRLRSIPGSKGLALFERVQQETDSLDDDGLAALKQIIMGQCDHDPDKEHLYGYALKAICEHIGEMIGGDVAAVRDHPYPSQLIANGSPIDLPCTKPTFPEIGYLDHSELAAEFRRATETKPKAKKTLVGFVLRKLSGGVIGREMSADDVADDMEIYAETLQACMDKKASLVSFRH